MCRDPIDDNAEVAVLKLIRAVERGAARQVSIVRSQKRAAVIARQLGPPRVRAA
jgi:hypothetical protein